MKLAEQEAEKNPDFLKVSKSQYNLLKGYAEWRSMAKPYGQGKVHKHFPKYVDEDPSFPWITDKEDPKYYAVFEQGKK